MSHLGDCLALLRSHLSLNVRSRHGVEAGQEPFHFKALAACDIRSGGVTGGCRVHLLVQCASGTYWGVMAIEIERKFLVRGEAWRSHAVAKANIRQAYLASGERSTTRVRIKNNQEAAVTIKSKRAELRRLEIEYAISVFDAEALLALRHSGLIEKARFTVPSGEHVWEVDVFCGDNAGLVIAEIELRHEDEHFDRPAWLGPEITGQSRFYNGSLARLPFCQWNDRSAATAAR